MIPDRAEGVTSPWPIGSRVTLARPDNPAHPRRGRTGVVTRAAPYPAKQSWDRGVPTETEPATWLVTVKFPDQGDGWDGCQGRLFPREFVVVEPEPEPVAVPEPEPEPAPVMPGPAPEPWGWSALFAMADGFPSVVAAAVLREPGLVETTVAPGQAARWETLADVVAWLATVGLVPGGPVPIGVGTGTFTPILLPAAPTVDVVHRYGVPFRYRHGERPRPKAPAPTPAIPPAAVNKPIDTPKPTHVKRTKAKAAPGPSLFALAGPEESR